MSMQMLTCSHYSKFQPVFGSGTPAFWPAYWNYVVVLLVDDNWSKHWTLSIQLVNLSLRWVENLNTSQKRCGENGSMHQLFAGFGDPSCHYLWQPHWEWMGGQHVYGKSIVRVAIFMSILTTCLQVLCIPNTLAPVVASIYTVSSWNLWILHFSLQLSYTDWGGLEEKAPLKR